MSKWLLINPPIRKSAPPNNAPLGLLYIAAYLEANGHEVDICDLNALREFGHDREFWLARYKKPYDVVGISGLITTYQEQRFILDYLVKNKKAFGDPMLISGGGLASSVPDFALRNMPELDAVVVGEGEVTALEIAEGKSLSSLPGIITKDRAVAVPRQLIPRLDDLPFPDYSKLPLNVYLGNPIWGRDASNSSDIFYEAKRSLNMIVSRGCTHSCGFCYGIWGKKYRLRSVDNVMQEIHSLKRKHDIDFIGFVDDNTIADRGWTMEFCKSLIDADLDIHWGCHARVDQVDCEKLELMRASGCEYVGFGIESASPHILKRMSKRADPRQAEEAIRMVRSLGMWANGTFIVGYPGETRETIAETAKFMRDNDMLGNMFYATAYPGTRLYDEVKDKILRKYRTEDAYIKTLGDATEFKVNLSDMEADDLHYCRELAIRGTHSESFKRKLLRRMQCEHT